MTETVFDGADDKVLNVFALDALGGGDMGDGFTITAFESKGNADLFPVVAANFEADRTPMQVRVLYGNTTVTAMAINCTFVALEQQAVYLLYPIDAFSVRPWAAFAAGFTA